jgi:hypothetical protein
MTHNTAANSDCELRLTQSASATTAYRIWYMAPEASAALVAANLVQNALDRHPQQRMTRELVPHTHRCVALIWTSDDEDKQETLNRIYHWFQAENWSANGEARPLIKALRLAHTSMSIGDIIEHIAANRFWIVADFGFTEILQ